MPARPLPLLALSRITATSTPPRAVQTIRVHQLQPRPTRASLLKGPYPRAQLATSTMNRQNRPRNRQPRPQRDQRPPRNNNRAGAPRPYPTSVPSVDQVVPGAHVSIVLKQDQPTGHETRGVVQDVLTSGNHPRGIKVRLRDGQVGRVQRMVGGDESGSSNLPSTSNRPSTQIKSTTTNTGASSRFTNRYTDIRNEEELEEPPPRSLADFLPPELNPREPLDTEESERPQAGKDVNATARCPVCDAFEGDEVAVSYHVEQECLAG